MIAGIVELIHDPPALEYITRLMSTPPVSSNGQHYKIDDCLEDNREDY